MSVCWAAACRSAWRGGSFWRAPPVWKSNFGRPTPSARRRPRNRASLMTISTQGAASSSVGAGAFFVGVDPSASLPRASASGVAASSSSGSGLGVSCAGVMAAPNGPVPSERAAASESTRGARRMSKVGRFLGGRWGWSFLRGEALGLQLRRECGVVRFRSDARAAFLRFDRH